MQLINLGQIITATQRRAVRLPYRQELAADGEHEHYAEPQDRESDGREVEERERFEPAFGEHLCRQDVGGVPTRVVVPPRIAPNARGMKSRPGASPARGAIVATAGMSTAVAAMLFMNAESTPATNIKVIISRVSLEPTILWMRPPIRSATPVSSSAAPTMNTDNMVITAGERSR